VPGVDQYVSSDMHYRDPAIIEALFAQVPLNWLDASPQKDITTQNLVSFGFFMPATMTECHDDTP